MLALPRSVGSRLRIGLIAGALVAANASAQSTYLVTNGNDSGPGSLRDGLASGAETIAVTRQVGTISINDTLVYDGEMPLVIRGSGQTVDGGGAGNTLLEVSQGADLTLSKLTFTDQKPGGWGLLEGGGKGIFLSVPESREGTVFLRLNEVTVMGVGDHGVHVRDCDFEECGNGNEGGGDGSPASIDVFLRHVIVDDVGNGSFDADGVRVDERGDGDIRLRSIISYFKNVGADGVELDEGNDGDVILGVNSSVFMDNGAYCEGLDVENPADPACIDDGELDLDDGFDVDEDGDGSVLGWVANSRLTGNLDEGIDFDEAGEGGFDTILLNVITLLNGDEGVKMSEEDPGDLEARLIRVLALQNDDDGMQIEEEGEGDLNVMVENGVAWDNAKVDLKVEQSDAGEGALMVTDSLIENIETNEGVVF